MNETRQQLKERLQAAGVWQDYLDLREQLVADGLNPAQAREQALHIDSRAAQQPIPGSESPPVENQTPMSEEIGPDFSRHIPNADAVQWAAENIANVKVRAEDAPSGLAWGLLQWARLTLANQTTFWASIWPKLLSGPAKSQEPGKQWDKESPCPTCGREPERPDRGTDCARQLLGKLITEGKAKKRAENAELAARPNAAAVGAARQAELKAALWRELQVWQMIHELERDGDQSETDKLWREFHDSFYCEQRVKYIELAIHPDPGKIISSLEHAVRAVEEHEKQLRKKLEERERGAKAGAPLASRGTHA